MPPITIRIFVSSTWLDLQLERQAVENVLQRMRETKFVGMEHFGSRDENTRRTSLDEVDRGQVYVGIFAGRYGSGITEDEYRRARALKLPCFIYFKRESEIPAEWRETDAAKIAKLAALKEELHRNHTVTEFDSTDDLAAEVTADLHRWLFDQYLQPKLERAAAGAMPRDQAQALLDAIRDTDALDAKLLSRVRQVIVSGERNVTAGGDISNPIIITGDGNVINVPAAPAFNPLHQVPSPPRDFTGRAEELGELLAALDRGAIISGLQGLGGVGKTALALKLAEQVKDRYPDAQFYLDLRGVSDKPLSPAEAMAQVIHAYCPTERLPESETELQPLYRSTLHDQRALLLMDNARDDAQVRPLIPPASCLLLVTSRRHFTLPEMKPLRLGALPPEDAVKLLRKVAPCIRDWDGHDAEIAAACGHLPLALRAAGSLLEVTLDLRPAEYAQQLRDARTRLETIGAEGVDHGVEASFNLSYERLTLEAARVFRQLSVFAGSFDAAAEEMVCKDDRHKRLSELVQLSLVEYDDGEQRYRLHDLARLFADSKLNEEEGVSLRNRHSQYFLDLASKAEKLIQETYLKTLDQESENIKAALIFCKEQSSDPWVGIGLASVLWKFWEIRGHISEGSEWIEVMLPHIERISGTFEKQAKLAKALHGAGVLSWCQSDFKKAAVYYDNSIAAYGEITDRQYLQGFARVLCMRGNVYRIQKEPEKAENCYREAQNIAEEVKDKEGEAIVFNELGNIKLFKQELEEAKRFYEISLSIHRILDDNKQQAIILNNLGLVAFLQRNYSESHQYYKDSLSKSGNDPRETARTMHERGNVYREQNDLESACKAYADSLEKRIKLNDQRSTSHLLEDIAWLLILLSRIEPAARLYKAAEEARKLLNIQPLPYLRPVREKYLILIQSRSICEAFNTFRDEGRKITLEESAKQALDELMRSSTS